MTAPFTVDLDPTPGRRQGEEQFVLHLDGEAREVVLHDYATVYSVPGLYEEVVQRRLQCASPATVADAVVEAGAAIGRGPADLRAFDLGAGNGVVGEELTARGVTVVVGADGIPEARDAAHRDRPGMYAHYLVGERLEGAEVARLVREERLDALVAAGAVGEGHVPVDALAELWSAFPAGSVLAAILMSMFYIGGELAQSRLGLPKSLTGVFQGLLLFTLLACDTLIAYRIRWQPTRPQPTSAPKSDAVVRQVKEA